MMKTRHRIVLRLVAAHPARISTLCLLAAALFATAPVPADHHTANLLRAEPNPVTVGGEVTIQGRNVLPVGGSYVSTVKYSTTTGSVLGELPSFGWGREQVRVRLPSGLAAGRYRLAVFRNGELASNWIELRVDPVIRLQSKIAAPMTTRRLRGSIRAQGPNVCAGEATIRVTGGPFEPGTGLNRPHARWERGKTFVELEVPGDRRATVFWNRMIYGVRIVNERELQARVGRCFLTEPGRRIRVIYPDGAISPWAVVAR